MQSFQKCILERYSLALDIPNFEVTYHDLHLSTHFPVYRDMNDPDMLLKRIGTINDALKPSVTWVAVLERSSEEQIPKLQSPERGFYHHLHLLSLMNIKKLLRMSNECKCMQNTQISFLFFLFFFKLKLFKT